MNRKNGDNMEEGRKISNVFLIPSISQIKDRKETKLNYSENINIL